MRKEGRKVERGNLGTCEKEEKKGSREDKQINGSIYREREKGERR